MEPGYTLNDLDELLGLPKGTTISPRLAELAARRWLQIKPTVKQQLRVRSLLGVTISHESIRQEVITARIAPGLLLAVTVKEWFVKVLIILGPSTSIVDFT